MRDLEITGLTRRTIVDGLIMRPGSIPGRLDQMEFLKRIWDLASMPSTDRRYDNAEGDIWKHTIANNDWDDAYLYYDYLNLRACPDEQFLLFAETAVHPMIGDESEIAERIREINQALREDGYRLVQASKLSGRPIYKAKSIGGQGPDGTPSYEIVLSFAGEDRAYVEQVADFLLQNDVYVFYDRYEEATLWGKDLAEHLDAVYRKGARYCVMFISRHYARKIWTNHERRSALARSIEERQEYILPARFDDAELPGLRPTVGYIDLTSKEPHDLGRLILQKLGRHLD